MKKYSVEGGIDFFAELYKSLDDDEPNNKTDEDNNKCLITNETLTDKFVEMNCGHKFNYIPLYNDLLNHKKKFNTMEGSATRLKHNEIRCPYCRKKQTGLMTYYEELNLPKISGVNYIDVNYDVETDTIPMTSHYKKCEFLTPNLCFNVNSQNVTEVYKQNLVLEDCKFIKCSHMGTQINYDFTSENFNDNKHYCWYHKKMIIKQYKKEKADKIKEEKKQSKLKEKEDLQNAKKEAKQKAKDEKQKAKDEKQKAKDEKQKAKKTKTVSNDNTIVIDLTNENVVIGVSNAVTVASAEEPILLCQELLKSGKNKGTVCGNKVFENNVCKRHQKIVT